MSNFWLKDERLIKWVFRAVAKAIDALKEGRFLSQEYGDIQDIINSSDVEAATKLIEEIGVEVPDVL